MRERGREIGTESCSGEVEGVGAEEGMEPMRDDGCGGCARCDGCGGCARCADCAVHAALTALTAVHAALTALTAVHAALTALTAVHAALTVTGNTDFDLLALFVLLGSKTN